MQINLVLRIVRVSGLVSEHFEAAASIYSKSLALPGRHYNSQVRSVVKKVPGGGEETVVILGHTRIAKWPAALQSFQRSAFIRLEEPSGVLRWLWKPKSKLEMSQS